MGWPAAFAVVGTVAGLTAMVWAMVWGVVNGMKGAPNATEDEGGSDTRRP